MSDLIDRQAAIDAFMKATGDGDKVDFCIGVIESVPSAHPRKGKWIYGEHDVAMCDGYRCDKCGFFVPWDYQHKFIDFINEYNFCPNCGARMDSSNE